MGPIHRAINLIVALVLAALGGGGFIYFYFIAAIWNTWMVVASGIWALLDYIGYGMSTLTQARDRGTKQRRHAPRQRSTPTTRSVRMVVTSVFSRWNTFAGSDGRGSSAVKRRPKHSVEPPGLLSLINDAGISSAYLFFEILSQDTLT